MSSNVTRTKRIFISDLHMGDDQAMGVNPPYKYPYCWLSQQRTDLLAEFLQKEILNSTDVKELIILGDLFDQWVCPDLLHPVTNFERIFNATHNAKVVQTLNNIISSNQGITVYYAPGNHDLLLDKTFMESHFPGIHFCTGNQPYVGVFQEDAIAGEHGSQYNFFCAPNPGHAHNHWLPLGFFLSRMSADDKALTEKGPAFFDILEHFAQKLLKNPTGLISDFLVAVAGGCGLQPSSEIWMDSLDSFGQQLTVNDMAMIYNDALKQWDASKPNGLNAVEAITTELTGFSNTAVNQYFQTNKARIAIFGHTHDAMLRGISIRGGIPYDDMNNGCGYIYANSGTWIDNHPCTYVETEIIGNQHHVRLFAYSDQGEKQKQIERYILTN